jgi:hypothetical protein
MFRLTADLKDHREGYPKTLSFRSNLTSYKGRKALNEDVGMKKKEELKKDEMQEERRLQEEGEERARKNEEEGVVANNIY